MILHITKDAGVNHYWLGGYADGYLIYPDDYNEIVKNCIEMTEVLGVVMSDLGFDNILELYEEHNRILKEEKENGKTS